MVQMLCIAIILGLEKIKVQDLATGTCFLNLDWELSFFNIRK